jgi:hypothetical protein
MAMQHNSSRRDKTTVVSVSLGEELGQQVQDGSISSFLRNLDLNLVVSELTTRRMSLMCTCATKMRGNIPSCFLVVLIGLSGVVCRVSRVFIQLLVYQSRTLRQRLLETELLSPNDVHVRYLMVRAC